LWYLPLLLLVIFRPLMTNHFAPEVKPLDVLQRIAGKSPPRPELVGTGTNPPSPADRG